ncbi:Fc.00g029880.m01.CDS01 [Cosmosporella sp. VM-42]
MSSRADLLVAHLQPQDPRPASPSHDGHSSDVSRAPSSQDPYYSNNDIRALHDIVATAQEFLDASPEPKPLPAAALFKAYDEVLPKFGIDPDTDHHLSTFVFRVGGERGDGSLIDKFQVILARMGIVLEFGDNTTVSYRTSPSNSPAFSSSSRQRRHDQVSHTGDHPSDESDVPKSPSLAASVDTHEEDEDDAVPRPEPDQEQVLLAARRAALSSVMGRWRSVVAERQGEHGQQRQALSTVSEKPTEEITTENRQIQGFAPIGTGRGLTNQSQRGGLHNEKGAKYKPTSHPPPPALPSFRNGWQLGTTGVQDDDLTDHVQEKEHEMPLTSESKTNRDIVIPQDPESDETTAKAMLRHPQTMHPQNTVTQPGVVTDHQPQDQVSSIPSRLGRELVIQVQPNYETPLKNRTESEMVEGEARHQRLLRRAARAREIYLASKVFNHWADRTARRIEREAVARRHMIRFRCFRGWSQAPPSREPEADQLRVVTAMRKWQRKITTQDDDLMAKAEAVAQSYRLKKAQKALDQWCCQHLEYVARQQMAMRTKKNILSSWMLQAAGTAALRETIKTNTASRDAVNALDKWQSHTEIETIRTEAAIRIGSMQQSFTYLREWWDQAEIDRRSRMYRHYILLKKASFAFTQWNLQARAQAFTWRREYLSVNHVFDTWCQIAEQNKNLRQTVVKARKDWATSQFLGRLDHQQQEFSRLSQLERRASLYIGATRLLGVFDVAIKQRKVRDKEQVKRYLMRKYEQMSSRRRKRNFFSAFDQWRAVAAQGESLRRAADNLKARKKSEQLMLAVETWTEQAVEDGQRYESAQIYHLRGWVVTWSDYTRNLEQRSVDAWQMWAVEKQRHYVKQWSISSLQQSGQAHTASKVHTKHDRERRNRRLQQWRQSSEMSKDNISGPDPPLGPKPFSRSSYRNSWGGLSGRRSGVRRKEENRDFLTSSFETPTRWTGQALPMSGIASRSAMAPVREADEDDAASSTTGGEEASIASPPRYWNRRTEKQLNLSTTTPRAPVPSHLEREFAGQYRDPTRPSGGSRWTTPNLSTQTTVVDYSELERPTGFQRPFALAARKILDRPAGPRSLRPPSTLQPLSGTVASRSVGVKPSGLRYATPQTSKTTLASPSFEEEASRTPPKTLGDARDPSYVGSMRTVLPGKPQSRLQGLASGYWDRRHINAYVTGNALAILDGSRGVIQTIYDDDEQPLEAISIDEATGKIATCTSTEVRVYKPLGLQEDALKWALESTFDIPHPDPETPAVLSWGSSEELLVATSSLSLFVAKAEPICSWEKMLPSPVKYALLSYDSAYIASTGLQDCLVKVWRRLTYGSDEVRFDLSYLRHPDIVTSVRWRKPFYIEQAAENALYTICLDNHVRIWTPTDTPDGKHWQLWGQIDVCESPRNNPSQDDMRLVFILDGRDFTASVERAVEDRMSDDPNNDEVAIEHLVAVANRNPEICIALDGKGSMSAWAFENVGSSTAGAPTIFNVAQVKSPHFQLLGNFLPYHNTPHVEVKTYCDRKSGKVHVLLHAFDGRIGVFTGSVADLFDPTTNENRLSMHSVWSGHSTAIKKIVRNFSGRAVVSRTGDGESIVWKHVLGRQGNIGPSLTRSSVMPEKGHIHRICVLRKGRFVVFLRHENVSLYDCRTSTATPLAHCPYQATGKPLCLIILPRQDVKNYTVAHIATVTSEGHGVVWEVNLPRYFDDPATTTGTDIQEYCRFELKEAEGLAYVLPVDPAGSTPVVSGFLDIFARDVAISYSHTGRVDFWTARIDPEQRSVGWLSTCTTQTGISNPALVSGSTLKKAALVNSTRSQVTIWDIGGSRLEYEQDFKTHNVIQDLDWTSTPDSQSILAVGFPSRVILLSQMRFDYLNKGPAWAQIREISIRELTSHPIGDSTWLGDGYLVIGAGNQMFVQDRQVGVSESLRSDLRLPPRKDGNWDLFEVVQRFNGPLPVFHPQFLSQCILSGKSMLVRRALVKLHKTLKYYIEGEVIDDYLGIDLQDFYTPALLQSRGTEKGSGSYLDGPQAGEDEDDEIFSEQTAVSINEKLTKISIPQLSGHEQIQLADIIECVSLVEKHRRSMDENGARFMLFFRQHALRKGRTNEMHLSWREINWAYHSNSQDILIDFVSRQNQSKMVWEHARESGIFMWLTDSNAVKAQFELIARNEYTKGEPKNPVDCSLFYLALRKKAVLQGLWRMANWNKEQGATQKLLANNFDDPKWKTTALKNGYALLSKRRFAYAAAFFLLADHLQDAVEVCMRQLKDMQLAIAVARVYEGDHGPVFRRLLQDGVLPLAAQEGNRWLASWAFWMLGRKDMSVRALITPVYTLLETPCSPDIKSRLFLTDDPALVVLYSDLRHQTLQTLRGASKVTPKVEWEFVLHSAKLYDRMGCDLMGLDLVRNWEFQKPAVAGLGGEVNPLKLLRRRSSLVVADLPSPTLQFQMRSGGEKRRQPPPTTFEEPDSSSLLDSFGF